jgi:hypothetical protein
MNIKQRTFAILVLITSLVMSGCGPGQLFGPTLTPTLPPTPTSTLTPTPIPSPTINPLPPLSMDAGDCNSMEQDSSIGMGRTVLVKGNLTIPAGSFELNADQYEIWLTNSPYLDDDKVRLDVLIPGGNKPNSMFFDDQKVPRIINNTGEILNWQKQNGYDVYKTYQQLTVTGIWQGKCPFKIDKIEWYFLHK